MKRPFWRTASDDDMCIKLYYPVVRPPGVNQ